MTVANFISTLDKPEAKAFVDQGQEALRRDAVVSNTVDAHYKLTRFFIEGVKRAGGATRRRSSTRWSTQSLMSGNGEVQLRPRGPPRRPERLIAETATSKLVLLKDIGAGQGAEPMQVTPSERRPRSDAAARGRGVAKTFGGVQALARRRPGARRGRAALHHRPQRLRQDHAVQRDHRRLRAHLRDGAVQGRRHHRAARRTTSPASGIARKFQVPGIYPSLTVAENLEVPLSPRRRRAAPLGLLRVRGRGCQRRDRLLRASASRARRTPAGALPHGQKQWLEIAMLLAGEAQLLLLDEPTAGMTAAETAATAELIRELRDEQASPVLVIEHDMSFVAPLGCPVIVMMRGSVLLRGQLCRGASAIPPCARPISGSAAAC